MSHWPGGKSHFAISILHALRAARVRICRGVAEGESIIGIGDGNVEYAFAIDQRDDVVLSACAVRRWLRSEGCRG